jgi:predicted nucleotidyltransferase component of viral defense system
MILPKPADALHKSWLYRLLITLLDDDLISQQIYFKGGTCAMMLGWLDRFSVDLDFDLAQKSNKTFLRQRLYTLFKQLGLAVKDESKQTLQFFLGYSAPAGQRNTLKLEILDKPVKSNDYAAEWLAEISRYALCQTRETMAANKLVAVTERWQKFSTLAGRDIYDLHYFFTHGFRYKQAIIKERTGLEAIKYLIKLKGFIDKKFNQRVIDQDLNTLLPNRQFQKIRKTLKQELLVLLNDEIGR